jgi:hypothetical protein
VKPNTNNPFEKRRKEVVRQQWQREKAERRQQRQIERQQRERSGSEEDPDLAGIVPGPQPPQNPPDET